MKRFIPNAIRAIAVVCVLAAPSAVLAATWHVEKAPLGPGYNVTDGETGTIHTQGRRAANKIAKILNKTGFVDPGSGPCHDPRSGVLC